MERRLIGASLPPPVPLADLLRAGLDARPDDDALVSLETRWTFRQLDDVSTRLAAAYRSLGVRPGDRIASLMPNRGALLVHYLACIKGRFVAVPLNYRYTPLEIDHALEKSGAATLLHHAERATDVAASRLADQLPQGRVTYGAEAVAAQARLRTSFGTISRGSRRRRSPRTRLRSSCSPRAAPGQRRG